MDGPYIPFPLVSSALVQACQHLRHLRLEYCLPVTADLATGLCRAGLKQLQTVAITGAPVEVKAIQALQS